MKKLLLFTAFSAIFSLFFIGCAQNEMVKETQIYESPEFINNYKNTTKNMNAEDIAKYEVSEFTKKFGGIRNRFRINDFIIFENVFTDKNFAVFDYSLTSFWAAGKPEDRQKAMENMKNNMIKQICAQQTKRSSIKKGYAEIHRYFYNYPTDVTFIVEINEQICEQAGLK